MKICPAIDTFIPMRDESFPVAGNALPDVTGMRRVSHRLNLPRFIKAVGENNNPHLFTFLRELVQNTCDSLEPGVRGTFSVRLESSGTGADRRITRILVRNNGRSFTDDDVDAIFTAFGSTKALDYAAGKVVGHIGIGFLSVTRVSMDIRVFSGRTYIHFDFTSDDPEDTVGDLSTDVPGSLFVLEVKEGLPPADHIRLTVEAVADHLARVIVFEDRMAAISVSEGDRTLVIKRSVYPEGDRTLVIKRSVYPEGDQVGVMDGHHTDELTSKLSGRLVSITTGWKGSEDGGNLPPISTDSYTIHGRGTVEVAIPVSRSDRPERVPSNEMDGGELYITFPAETPSGFPFHVNGQFTPRTSRDGIVLEGEGGARNLALFRELGELLPDLFVRSLKDHFLSPSGSHEELARVVLPFIPDRERLRSLDPLGSELWESIREAMVEREWMPCEGGVMAPPDTILASHGEARFLGGEVEGRLLDVGFASLLPEWLLTDLGVEVMDVTSVMEYIRVQSRERTLDLEGYGHLLDLIGERIEEYEDATPGIWSVLRLPDVDDVLHPCSELVVADEDFSSLLGAVPLSIPVLHPGVASHLTDILLSRGGFRTLGLSDILEGFVGVTTSGVAPSPEVMVGLYESMFHAARTLHSITEWLDNNHGPGILPLRGGGLASATDRVYRANPTVDRVLGDDVALLDESLPFGDKGRVRFDGLVRHLGVLDEPLLEDVVSRIERLAERASETGIAMNEVGVEGILSDLEAAWSFLLSHSSSMTEAFPGLMERLGGTSFILDMDGVLRSPRELIPGTERNRRLLGSHGHYIDPGAHGEGTLVFLREMGMEDRPRPSGVLRAFLDDLKAGNPTRHRMKYVSERLADLPELPSILAEGDLEVQDEAGVIRPADEVYYPSEDVRELGEEDLPLISSRYLELPPDIPLRDGIELDMEYPEKGHVRELLTRLGVRDEPDRSAQVVRLEDMVTSGAIPDVKALDRVYGFLGKRFNLLTQDEKDRLAALPVAYVGHEKGFRHPRDCVFTPESRYFKAEGSFETRKRFLSYLPTLSFSGFWTVNLLLELGAERTPGARHLAGFLASLGRRKKGARSSLKDARLALDELARMNTTKGDLEPLIDARFIPTRDGLVVGVTQSYIGDMDPELIAMIEGISLVDEGLPEEVNTFLRETLGVRPLTQVLKRFVAYDKANLDDDPEWFSIIRGLYGFLIPLGEFLVRGGTTFRSGWDVLWNRLQVRRTGHLKVVWSLEGVSRMEEEKEVFLDPRKGVLLFNDGLMGSLPYHEQARHVALELARALNPDYFKAMSIFPHLLCMFNGDPFGYLETLQGDFHSRFSGLPRGTVRRSDGVAIGWSPGMEGGPGSSDGSGSNPAVGKVSSEIAEAEQYALRLMKDIEERYGDTYSVNQKATSGSISRLVDNIKRDEGVDASFELFDGDLNVFRGDSEPVEEIVVKGQVDIVTDFDIHYPGRYSLHEFDDIQVYVQEGEDVPDIDVSTMRRDLRIARKVTLALGGNPEATYLARLRSHLNGLNHSGRVFVNLDLFIPYHKVETPLRVLFTVAHELAHNTHKGHGKDHIRLMNSLIIRYLTRKKVSIG